MNKQAIEKYIKEKDCITIPEVQLKFALGYKEARALFAMLEKSGTIRLDKNLNYVSCEKDINVGNVINRYEGRKSYPRQDLSEFIRSLKARCAEIKDAEAEKDAEGDKKETSREPLDVGNLITVLKAVTDKKSEPITTDKEPDCSLWTDKMQFKKEVLKRFNFIIKSNPKQRLDGAIKIAEARLEALRDSHDRKMLQLYERVVYEFKSTTHYRYNVLRRKLCGN